jgi:sugar transferase EpsL
VKPSITEWVQANVCNRLASEKEFRLDVRYVDNWSFALGFRIPDMTVRKVLRRDGIGAEGYATMPEFTGTDEAQGR